MFAPNLLYITASPSQTSLLQPLEPFVNLQNKRQLAHYVKSRILIPETLVVELETEHITAFVRDPEGFDARVYGDRWLREKENCVLRVPSRVVVEKFNYLINRFIRHLLRSKQVPKVHETVENL
jgi:hypothetical protein